MIIRMHERVGVALRRMGEFGKAAENYEKIFQLEKKFNEHSAKIDYLIGRGLVYAEMGKNVAADNFYQQALGLAKTSRDPTKRAIVLGNLGNLYLDIGHYEKAQAVTEEAYALIDSVGNPHTKISLSNILIEILAETNQYEDAKLLAEKTLHKLAEHQFGLLEADSYLSIGKLHFQIGDWQKAFKLFDRARALSEKKGFIVNQIESLTMLAETCRRKSQLEGATKFINQALELCKRYPFADPKWHAYFELARIERDTGDIAAAEASFDEAIGVVKTLAAEIKDTESRSNFSEKIQSIFEEMVLLQLAQNDSDDALIYAELERAQVFKVLLQQNFENSTEPESITASAFQLGKKETHLSFTLPKLQSLLRAHELVVEYELTDSLLIIWVIGRNTFAVATKTISRNTINNWVKDFRTCTNLDTLYNRAKIAENYTKIESLCTRFYDKLISPIAEHLSDAGLIYFIPDETLNYLSFAALMDSSGEFLIRRHPIVMMPSAEILYQLLSSKARRTVGSNTLLVAATNPDLEYSFVEARAAAKKFAAVDSLIGVDKTELELKHKLTTKSFDVILLSLHGRVNEKRPHLSALVLNRAFAESSAAMDNDAQIMLSEIQPLPLDATNLVYLSACESASGRLYRGEGIVGLQRAFLIAGASSVIANLWKIDDKSAQKQTEAFFDIWLQKKISKAEALQQTQLNLIDSLKHNQVYKGKAHPCLWASVTLTGIPN
jgi:CHAT domain-containing protein/Tfp pilus assembly protein PilF